MDNRGEGSLSEVLGGWDDCGEGFFEVLGGWDDRGEGSLSEVRGGWDENGEGSHAKVTFSELT